MLSPSARIRLAGLAAALLSWPCAQAFAEAAPDALQVFAEASPAAIGEYRRKLEAYRYAREAFEAEATAYWNKHRHPFVWGRRRRHRPRRCPGIAAVPGVRGLAG